MTPRRATSDLRERLTTADPAVCVWVFGRAVYQRAVRLLCGAMHLHRAPPCPPGSRWASPLAWSSAP